MALCASKVWDKPNGPIVSEQRDCRPREQVLPFGPGPWQGMDHRLGIMGQNTIEASQSWKPILQASTQHLPTHQMPLRQNWLKLYSWDLLSTNFLLVLKHEWMSETRCNGKINDHFWENKVFMVNGFIFDAVIASVLVLWLINHQCCNPLLYPTMFISNSIYFQLFFTFFSHHCYT